jgi:hypothetical protein
MARTVRRPEVEPSALSVTRLKPHLSNGLPKLAQENRGKGKFASQLLPCLIMTDHQSALLQKCCLVGIVLFSEQLVAEKLDRSENT